MRTRRRPHRLGPCALCATALAFALVLTLDVSAVSGQAPLSLVNPDTGVRSIEFQFLDHQSFSEDRLRGRLGLLAPGAMGRFRDRFAFLPLVSSGFYPFSPVEVQKDLVRLRRFYAQSGFPRPDIDYHVTLDEGRNQVRVVFSIREGPPVTLGALSAVSEDGSDPRQAIAPDIEEEWPALLGTLSPGPGERVGDYERVQIQSRVAGWLRNRGYPFASVETRIAIDTTTWIGDLELLVRPGSRARIGSVRVEGTRTLRDQVIFRELGVGPGDQFSAARLAEGERQLFGLDLVRLAIIDAPDGVTPDSTVDLRVRVEEGLPRVIAGQLGYASEVGITGQADWTHRNFLGDARTLTVTGQGRTGQLGIGTNVQKRYSASVTLKQPYVFNRRISLLVTPLVEYRDDLRDRSVQLGTDATLVYERGRFRTMSLQFGVGRRRVLDYRLGGTEGLDYLAVLATLDSLDQDLRTSTVTAAGTWGRIDDALAPRSGYFVRASAEVTGPPSLSTLQYRRLDASLTRFVPLHPRSGLIFRGSVGRIFPFGRSVPDRGADPTSSLLRLRDVLFTAGGGYDVRGWGEQQLGPKFPDVRLVESGTEVVASADRYVPLGGLARLSASAELRLPLPGVGPKHSTHVFLDAGKVWNPDTRFGSGPTLESRVFVSTGAGLEVGTLVGAVRLSVGYKLNPSPFDLRDPGAVLEALVRGDPVSSIPTRGIKRWHLHLILGQAF